MRVTAIWTAPRGARHRRGRAGRRRASARRRSLARARRGDGGVQQRASSQRRTATATGDPTEVAMLAGRRQLGRRRRRRRARPRRAGASSTSTRCSSSCRRSTSATASCGSTPRARPRRCCRAARPWSRTRRARARARRRPSAREIAALVEDYAAQGLRVLAVAQRRLGGRRAAARAPRAGRARPLLPRAGRDGRPAPAEVADAVAALPRGRHPHHRRSPATTA